MLTDAQRRALVRIARSSVEAEVTGHAIPLPVPHDLPPASGAFVTVRVRGELRGCLGTLACDEPLDKEIARCAHDAASRDPRFEPLEAEDLAALSVEVSVLGPLESIDPADAGAVVVGRHGLVAELGRRRGLLLPQVATEWGWTREQFLRQTCVKAGLPPDAWQNGATIYRFDADVFGD